MSIFISYSPEDIDFVRKLKQAIEAENIGETIDIESLKFGDNLQEFLERSVRQTDITISIISKHSLQSVWVIAESLETLMYEKIERKKKFLPIYIDQTCFDDSFYLKVGSGIDEALAKLKHFIAQALQENLGISHYEQKRKRLSDLRNHLDTVLVKLHSIHLADFSNTRKFHENLPKLIESIQKNKREVSEYKKFRTHELVNLYNFDLSNIVATCMESVWGRSGLIGFAVHCNSPRLLQNLCKRLEYQWDSDAVEIKKSIPLHPLYTNINHALSILERRCCHSLERGDVIIVVNASETTANTFWESLYKKYAEGLQHRLVVILALSSPCNFSCEITELPPLEFRIPDVLDWVKEVVERLNWPRQVVRKWTNQIIHECCDKEELHQNRLIIEFVYDHLEEARKILQQNPTYKNFLYELEMRWKKLCRDI